MDRPTSVPVGAREEVGARTLLDPQHNTATIHDLELIDTLSTLTAFLPNADEAMSMTGTDSPEAAAETLGAYVPLVVVKDGAAGECRRAGRGVRFSFDKRKRRFGRSYR